jgi:basic membrane protein A
VFMRGRRAVWAAVVASALVAHLGIASALRAAPRGPLPLRVTLVAAQQPGDPGLAEGAVRGLRAVRSTLGRRISVAYVLAPADGVDPGAVEAVEPRLTATLEAAARSSDLVIASGDFLTGPAVRAAARRPATRFVLVSSIHIAEPPSNLSEGWYRRDEEAFLAGAAAALVSRSHVIGFIGPVAYGAEQTAYRAGARSVAPRVRVLADALAVTVTGTHPGAIPESWRSAGDAGAFEPGTREPRAAEEVALAQFDLGADVVYAVAGASNAGTYRAAVARDRWVITRGAPGSERALPQRWRDHTLVTITERPDAAVYQLVRQLVAAGRLPPHLAWGVAPFFAPRRPAGPVPPGVSPLDKASPVGFAVHRHAGLDTRRIASILAGLADRIRTAGPAARSNR